MLKFQDGIKDGIKCNSTFSELLKDESIHFNHITMPFQETFVTDEQFEHNDSSTRTLEFSVNLNLRK